MTQELSTLLVFLAGICGYACISHLQIGLRRPRDATHVLFGILCALIAISAFSASTLHTEPTAAFAAFRGLVVVLFGIVFPWFTSVYTGARDRVLPITVGAIYAAAWIVNFAVPAMLVGADTARSVHPPFAIGDTQVGLALHWAGHVLMFVHLYYACWRQYRRGERHRAVALACSALPLLLTTVSNALVMAGIIDFVFTRNFGFMALVLLMSLSLGRELGQKRLQMQTVLDNVPAVIFMKDRLGRYLLVNRQFERLHGTSLQAVRGKTDAELHAAERAERLQCNEQQVLKSGKVVETEETVQRDGQTRVYSSIRFPLVDRGGRCYGLCGISTDISERIAAAVALRHLASNMEALANRRTAELAAVNRELEAFSYSVSHDLRAPITTISGFADLLIKDHGTALDPDARRFMERIREAARHMAQLIEDLLALARQAREPLRSRTLNLSELALSCILRLQETTPQRHVEIAIPDDLPAHGDPRLLAIAMDNLLGNAWKYTARTGRARIEVGVLEREQERVFFVADNGAGFEPQEAARLFQPFNRLHSERDFPGTGIGLCTAARVIQRHGGRIWATGKPGSGATFYFTLPQDGAAAHACPAHQAVEPEEHPVLAAHKTGTG